MVLCFNLAGKFQAEGENPTPRTLHAFSWGSERETTMTTEPIRSREEAREQLKRLEDFYGVPVLPLRSFCDRISIWMDCIVKNNTDPELTKGGMQHGYKYYEALKQMRIDIMKSNLLGRLFYAKEPLRTRMCPVHKGHYSGEAMFFQKCLHLCDGTGWLRESPDDSGYTGIKISEFEAETIAENGVTKIRNPQTGDWEILE
jgi:hypothetical protein